MTESSSSELDISKLGIYQARRFVPVEVDLADAGVAGELYQQLIDRTIESAEELEEFLLDRSELESAIEQAGTVLYIRMTCQTDDKQRTEAYKAFVEEVEPVMRCMSDKLDRKYLKACEEFVLDEKEYEVYNRAIRCDVELFKEENVKLQTEESLLSQEYQAICGAMTVDFDGEEKTLQEMTKLLEEPDRSLRESAWRGIFNRRMKDAGKLDDIFDKMLFLREQIAQNSGFDNYRDYKFRERHRFDYTPQDCKDYHTAVEKLLVPLLKRMYERRSMEMGVSTVRPWDTQVDPKGRAPLRPFSSVEEYISGSKTIFSRVDAEFGDQFEEINSLGLLDLASRKGKAPGGYQATLLESRKPFIFANAVGCDSDIRTLTHEGGHAFHALAAADHRLIMYRHAPTEFGEVASMSMELFTMGHLAVFYNEEQVERSKLYQFERIVRVLVYVAMADSFQHWIYENPGHDRSQRADHWAKLCERFYGQFEDWSGLEDERRYEWHRILHIFQFPFYMIEYGIAQLGALGLWMQLEKDSCSTIVNYRKALSLGGSRPLPELFESAGLEFDFSERTMGPMVEAVAEGMGL